MSLTQSAKKPHLPELDIVRAIGIMAVVMIHSTSSAVNSYDHASSFYPVYVFLNMFSKFAVPVFIFLSGFVLFYNYFGKPWTLESTGQFYKKRITKLAIPFILFSFFYWAFVKLVGPGFVDLKTFIGYFADPVFWDKLLIGKTYTHLYFIVIIIQFYLLAPLMLSVLKKFPALGNHIVWIGLLVQWLFIYKVVPLYGLTNTASYSFTYLFYFAAGAFIGIHYLKLAGWIKIRKQNASAGKISAWVALWTLFLGSSIYMVMNGYHFNAYNKFLISSKQLELVNEVQCVTAGLALIQLSHWIYDKWNKTLVRALLHIGATSFGIYLLHPVVTYFNRTVPTGGSSFLYHLWAATGFLIALLLPWLIVSLSARWKWHWLLFGPLPTSKKAAPSNTNSKISATL
ncbi:acyltransferase [Paenibacillus harenae]|uniref:acyltransferase n=1 Tax=Paenibacillus harenae TaxID=306543 RepID=UPI0027D92E2E|nr:acyltransferase [Paenibacillus harenae]